MSRLAADYRKLVQFALALGAALLVIAAMRLPVQADTSHMIVIPASDGYGFDDCLGEGKTCGKVIADAWCEAHGLADAISFGRADDVTATMPGVAAPKVEPGSFLVNCGEAAKH